MKYKNIENFIFDFGGVLYEVDLEISVKKLCGLSSDPFIRENGSTRDYSKHKLFNDYECGKISTNQFLESIKADFSLNLSDDFIIKTWNETLVGLYHYSIDIIRSFKNIGNIFLFSNTSDIHYRQFYPECTDLFKEFKECFFSFMMGLRKPNPESYNYIIDKHNLNPGKTLFIDDYIKNIEGAIKCGLQVYHINYVNSLSDLLHSVESDTQVK